MKACMFQRQLCQLIGFVNEISLQIKQIIMEVKYEPTTVNMKVKVDEN